MNSLNLTSPQVLEAVRQLENLELPARTLAKWAATGLVVPSVAWAHTRGRYNTRLYNLSDLARVRLIVRMRHAGISLPRVRAVLAYLDAELREVLKPNTRAQLVLNGFKGVIVRSGHAPAVDVPSGQFRLELREVVATSKTVEGLVA